NDIRLRLVPAALTFRGMLLARLVEHNRANEENAEVARLLERTGQVTTYQRSNLHTDRTINSVPAAPHWIGGTIYGGAVSLELHSPTAGQAAAILQAACATAPGGVESSLA